MPSASLWSATFRAAGRIVLLATTAFGGHPGARPIVAQETQPSPQFRSEVNAERLVVWVTDRNGAAIGGLTCADFSVTTHGDTVPLLDCEERTTGALPATGDAPEVVDSRPEAGDAGEAPVEFWVYLDFVTRSPSPLVVHRAIVAAMEWVRDYAPAGAPVGVAQMTVTHGFDLQVLAQPTLDRDLLLRVLDTLRYHPPPMQRAQNSMLWALTAITPMLEKRSATSRVDVLFISRGDPDGMMVSDGYREAHARTTGRLQDANVVLHGLNPESLPSPFDSDHSAPGSSSGSDRERRRRLQQRLRAIANRGPLRDLAHGTGGVATFFNHTFPDAYRTVVAAARSYYVLTVQADGDAPRAELEVSVEGESVGTVICPECGA